jgi:hypothetical protein
MFLYLINIAYITLLIELLLETDKYIYIIYVRRFIKILSMTFLLL